MFTDQLAVAASLQRSKISPSNECLGYDAKLHLMVDKVPLTKHNNKKGNKKNEDLYYLRMKKKQMLLIKDSKTKKNYGI